MTFVPRFRRPWALFSGALITCVACGPTPHVDPALGTTPRATANASAEPKAAPLLDPNVLPQVERLKNVETQSLALDRLDQMFNELLIADFGNRSGERTKAFIEAVIAPSVELCKNSDSMQIAREKAIRLLTKLEHPDALPCFVEVLSQVGTAHRTVMAFAVDGLIGQRAAAQKSNETKEKVLKAFTQVRLKDLLPNPSLDAFGRGVLALADASWEGTFIEILEKSLAGKESLDEYRWHASIAIEALGNIRSEKAIAPLVRMLLHPLKRSNEYAILMALLNIGKTANQTAIALLRGEPKDWVQTSKSLEIAAIGAKPSKASIEFVSEEYKRVAARIIGVIGREEGAAALIAAIPGAGAETRAVIGRALIKLPPTPETLKAYREIVEGTKPNVYVGFEERGLDTLLRDMPNSFDGSLAGWVTKMALGKKKDDFAKAQVRELAFKAALSLAAEKDLPELAKLAKLPSTGAGAKTQTVGQIFEGRLDKMQELLAHCKDNSGCYLDVALRGENQQSTTTYLGTKAARMAVMIGGEGTKDKLFEALSKTSDEDIRRVLLYGMVHLSPQGDTALAVKLQSFLGPTESSNERESRVFRQDLLYVVGRLRARAEP